MSPTRPTLRIRPRSGIADPELARRAVTELPHLPSQLRSLRPRTLWQLVRSPERVLEPERVIVVTASSPTRSVLRGRLRR